MSKFELQLDTDNAAFEDYEGEMIQIFGRIMSKIYKKDYLDNKWTNVMDTNGNIVGTFRISK